MLLASIAEASRRVSETAKRLEKTALLADVLRQLRPEEIEAAVAFLSGAPRQGRMGVGYAALHGAMPQPASAPSLEILQVDPALRSTGGSERLRAEQRKRFLLARSSGLPRAKSRNSCSA